MVSKWPIWSVKVWLTSPSGGSDWSTVTNRTLSQHCPGFAYYFARLFSAKPGNCYLANTYSSTKNVFQPFVNRIIQYYITAKKTDYKYGATCDITAVNISEGGGWVQLSLRLRGERSCCAVWRRSCRNRLEQAVCGVAVLINYPPLTVPAHQQYSCHLSRSTKKKNPNRRENDTLIATPEDKFVENTHKFPYHHSHSPQPVGNWFSAASFSRRLWNLKGEYYYALIFRRYF